MQAWQVTSLIVRMILLAPSQSSQLCASVELLCASVEFLFAHSGQGISVVSVSIGPLAPKADAIASVA